MANIQSNINQLLAMASRLSIGKKVIKGQEDIAAAVKPKETEEDRQMAYEAERSEAMYKELEAEALERGFSSVEEYESAISAGQRKAMEEAQKKAAIKEKQEAFKKLVFQGTPYENIENPERLKRGNK